MRLIAIDTSGSALSAALLEDQGVIAAGGRLDGRNHSLGLLPLVQDLLRQTGLRLRDLDACAVTIGPGSFTGLRIGVATAKAWQDALSLPLITVSSTEAQARMAAAGGYICPLFDARRNEVYAALFLDGARLLPDLALPPLELAGKLREYAAPITFIGDGLARYGPLFQTQLRGDYREQAEPENLYLAKAAALIAAAKYEAREFTPNAQVLPLYLRPAEAEEKRLQREGEATYGS